MSESKWLVVTWWTGTQKDALGRIMANLFKLVKELDPKNVNRQNRSMATYVLSL